jgi:hypothetical protein
MRGAIPILTQRLTDLLAACVRPSPSAGGAEILERFLVGRSGNSARVALISAGFHGIGTTKNSKPL